VSEQAPEKTSPGLNVMSDTAAALAGGPVIELRPVPHPAGKPYSIAPDHEAPGADPVAAGASRPSAAHAASAGIPVGPEVRRDAGEAPGSRRAPPPRLDVAPPSRSERLRPEGVRERQAAASQQRPPTMAALMVVAACIGAVSGALATVGVTSFASSPQPQPAVVDHSAADAAIRRIDAEVASLKEEVDRAAKADAGQFTRTSERIDKTSERTDRIEKVQAEHLTRIARLSDVVDKLRVTAASASAREMQPAAMPTTARETASTAPAVPMALTPAPPAMAGPAASVSAGAGSPAASARNDVARLPVVEGWRLRDAGNGRALIEGRGGLYEVFAGNPVPGLGRIDAIRRQDGHWVVVTSKGLIVGH